MIAALISSAFQVQYPVEGQMVIIDPPVLWIIVWWYAVALVGLLALVGCLSTKKNRAVIAVSLILLGGGGVLGWKSSAPSSVAIDKHAGTLTFREAWITGDYVLPLSELKYATVETDTAAYRLVFVMEGGHRRSLGPFSSQTGQPEAAHAINKFLGVESKP